MNDRSVTKLGGICSLIVGILYVLIGITFLLLPVEQKGGTGIDDLMRFYSSFHKNPTVMTLLYLEFAICAIIAIAAVPAISGLVRNVSEGWTRWTSNLAYLGFAVIAIYYFQMIAMAPSRAAVYVAGDAATKAAIAVPVGVDPQFLLRYGVLGLWLFVVGILGLRGGKLPKALSCLGIVAGILYWLLAASDVLGSETIVRSIIALVGGVIAGPIWYMWIGIKLLKSTSAGG
jgi:hypothetical protein